MEWAARRSRHPSLPASLVLGEGLASLCSAVAIPGLAPASRASWARPHPFPGSPEMELDGVLERGSSPLLTGWEPVPQPQLLSWVEG